MHLLQIGLARAANALHFNHYFVGLLYGSAYSKM